PSLPYPIARQSSAPPRVSPPGALPQIMLVRLTSAVGSRGPAVTVKNVSSMLDKSTTLNEEDPFVDGGSRLFCRALGNWLASADKHKIYVLMMFARLRIVHGRHHRATDTTRPVIASACGGRRLTSSVLGTYVGLRSGAGTGRASAAAGRRGGGPLP